MSVTIYLLPQAVFGLKENLLGNPSSFQWGSWWAGPGQRHLGNSRFGVKSSLWRYFRAWTSEFCGDLGAPVWDLASCWKYKKQYSEKQNPIMQKWPEYEMFWLFIWFQGFGAWDLILFCLLWKQKLRSFLLAFPFTLGRTAGRSRGGGRAWKLWGWKDSSGAIHSWTRRGATWAAATGRTELHLPGSCAWSLLS